MSIRPILDRPLIEKALGRRSKFNVRTDMAGKLRRTLDGVVYDSAAERYYAAQLTLEHNTGCIMEWVGTIFRPMALR